MSRSGPSGFNRKTGPENSNTQRCKGQHSSRADDEECQLPHLGQDGSITPTTLQRRTAETSLHLQTASGYPVVSFHSCVVPQLLHYLLLSLMVFPFLTSCVHLITLPTHSRWLKCCFVIPKIIVRGSVEAGWLWWRWWCLCQVSPCMSQKGERVIAAGRWSGSKSKFQVCSYLDISTKMKHTTVSLRSESKVYVPNFVSQHG